MKQVSGVVMDEVAVANKTFWEAEVEKGGGHTIPWLDLDLGELRRYIAGEYGGERVLGRESPRRYVNMHHADLKALGEVEGKDVLCLSCGGGQQSAVFGLLGANVTVVDLAEGQLAGDREAGDHFGYDARTIHADARDLSAIDRGSIDIVWAMTPCYVPSIREIYGQVASVLRPGGLYRTDLTNPALFTVDWDGGGYRILTPYSERVQEREDGAIEFRHYFDDMFNGLFDNGLTLTRVEDHSRDNVVPADVEPGSYRHHGAWIGGGITLFARKVDS